MARSTAGLVEDWLRYPHDPSTGVSIGEWRGLCPPERITRDGPVFSRPCSTSRKGPAGFPSSDYISVTLAELVRQAENIVSVRRKGLRIVVCATMPDNGRLIGFTEVTWSPLRPSILSQGFTAVLPAFRGGGHRA
ncbi:MAG: hypothetical protein MZV64_36960 [Ignavibacteriales bacterium]|nr:hypothetical protein [Ignavibacteriales bacterium]